MKKGDLSKAAVWKYLHWRHRDDAPGREEALQRLGTMLEELIEKATAEKLQAGALPGGRLPRPDRRPGFIVAGGQNLPGNWEGNSFNLAHDLVGRLDRIQGHEPVVVIHNDAVVQGLSEIPRMKDVSHWGVFTIGTELGNARFTNRETD